MTVVNTRKFSYDEMLGEIRRTPEIKTGFYRHNVTGRLRYSLGLETDVKKLDVIYLVEMRPSSALYYLRTGHKDNVTKLNLRETDALNWYRNATYLGNKKPDN